MIEAKVSELAPLRLDTIQELVRSTGPCITLLLPPYRPGAQAKSMAALIKTDLQEAQRQLASRKIPEHTISDLLAPLAELTREKEFLDGSHSGRAVFLSPDVFRQYELIGPVDRKLAVGGCFQIRPILGELHLPPEFYILKLAKNRVALLRCAHLRAVTMVLPKFIPETAEQVLEFDQPDHDLKNRSAIGPSAGNMRGASFGTSTLRETQHTYLADYYKAVDHGIKELLHVSKAPLVLAGVDEDRAIYRNIATYHHLLEHGIHGNPADWIAEEDLLEQAYAIVRADSIEQAAAELAESRERVAPGRFSTNLDQILQAAVEGRVHRLYLDEAAQKLGVFEGVKRGGRWHWGEEDLYNIVAVETLLQRGLVYSLPGNKMPEGAAAAAVLRF